MKGQQTAKAWLYSLGSGVVYIGWGHCVQPHETFKKNLTLEQADSLLRSDLRTFCEMFRKYGKDSLLLAVLAYNVGPYKVLGDRRKFRKSRLLQKIERGERNIEREYLDFCRCKQTDVTEYKQYKRVQEKVNRTLKKLGIMIGLKTPLTSYVARHSWASIARDMNKSNRNTPQRGLTNMHLF